MIAPTEQNSARQLLRTGSESITFTVYVQYLNRWFRGCEFETLEAAIAEALDSFRRSSLGVEVRDSSNKVRFRQRAGVVVEAGAELIAV